MTVQINEIYERTKTKRCTTDRHVNIERCENRNGAGILARCCLVIKPEKGAGKMRRFEEPQVLSYSYPFLLSLRH